ncbi:MAG: PAS domain S-box protein [Anaerolineae bacterium]|nr:PAS domain S-box protein [Anaerolineae bacterium]
MNWCPQTLFPQLFLEHNLALAAARDRAGVAGAMCAFLAACADHGTVFLCEYGSDGTLALVEVTATRDRSGGELLPLAMRYTWEDFPLRAAVPMEGIRWINVSQATSATVDAWLSELLHLQRAAVAPLVAEGRALGFLLAGWRGEAEPPTDFATTVEAIAVHAAYKLLHQYEVEQVLSQARLAIQSAEEERIFRDLVENAGDAIDIVEPDLVPFYVNPAFARLYGFDSVHEAMVGADLLLMTPPEERQRLEEEILPQARAGMWQGTLQRLRQDGSVFTAAVTMFGIRDADGNLIGLATIARDETARLELESSLREQARLRDELVAAQSRLIEELSTPIIPVTDGILVMPIIGAVDTKRARNVTRALLAGIGQYRARVVILDITGVPLVDSGVAEHLNKAIQAARLKGAQTIITGISEAVAETVVDLGIDWSGIKTLADLQAGIHYALALMGKRIVAST